MTWNPLNQCDIHFSVDPADRSVGIMAEGFTAWFKSEVPGLGTDFFCELTELGDSRIPESWEFEWFDGDTGNKIDLPTHPAAKLLERSLGRFAHSWYDAQEEALNT